MRTRTFTVTVAAGLALLTAACGTGSDDTPSAGSGTGARRVEVAMVDIDFEPTLLEVAKGEEIRFTFTNDGKIRHEAYFGTPEEQADHEKEMADAGKESDGHEDHGGGGDDDNNNVTVDPGEKGEITYRFEEAGTYEIGCHEPGHYAAGMKITVNVS